MVSKRKGKAYLQKLIDILRRNSVCSSPDLSRLNSLHIEASHQTKVAASTLQRPEEVAVAGGVGLDDGAVRKHNLVVDDSVAAESDLVTVEVDAAGEQQTGDTDGTETASGYGEVVGFEVVVDGGPSFDIRLCFSIGGMDRVWAYLYAGPTETTE